MGDVMPDLSVNDPNFTASTPCRASTSSSRDSGGAIGGAGRGAGRRAARLLQQRGRLRRRLAAVAASGERPPARSSSASSRLRPGRRRARRGEGSGGEPRHTLSAAFSARPLVCRTAQLFADVGIDRSSRVAVARAACGGLCGEAPLPLVPHFCRNRATCCRVTRLQPLRGRAGAARFLSSPADQDGARRTGPPFPPHPSLPAGPACPFSPRPRCAHRLAATRRASCSTSFDAPLRLQSSLAAIRATQASMQALQGKVPVHLKKCDAAPRASLLGAGLRSGRTPPRCRRRPSVGVSRPRRARAAGCTARGCTQLT